MIMRVLEVKKISGRLAAFVIVLLFFAVHQIYVTRTHPDAPYMDTLRLVYQLEQWRSGHLPFLGFWGLGGQHQGFINQLFLLGNVRLFSFDVILANRLTGVVVSLVTATLLFNFVVVASRNDNGLSGKGLVARLAVSFLIAAICFSWAGFELFTLDLGLPLWVKNLSFVTYFSMHAWYLRAESSHRSTWIAGLGLTLVGPVIILLIGMGWSYSFVAAVAFASAIALIASFRSGCLREQLAKSVPLVSLLIAQLIYAAASMGAGGSVSAHQQFSALIRIPMLLLYALGSGIIGSETAQNYTISLDVFAFIGGGMLVAVIVLVLVRFRRSIVTLGSLVPLYLLAYGFFTALSVSAARGHEGASAVMASRYYMDIMLFCVGLVWLWYEDLAQFDGKRSLVSVVGFSVLCVVIVVGQGLTYTREWRAAPYRALAFKAMNEALLSGVPDQAAASLLQSPLDYARKGDRVLLEHHLALYSDFPAGACMADGVRFVSGWYAKESSGVWMGRSAVMQVPACRCDFVASVYLPADFPERVLTVSDAEFHQTIVLIPGKAEQLRISPSNIQRAIDISVSGTTRPSSLLDGAHDVRNLGVLWTGNAFACGGNAFN